MEIGHIPNYYLILFISHMSLPIHLIASQHFFPALLAHIPHPLDHVIFQSILLCLIAGDKHLILRTPEEDIGLVAKLAVWVSSSWLYHRLVGNIFM